MTPTCFLTRVRPILNDILRLQEAADKAPMTPKTNHEKVERAYITQEFPALIEKLSLAVNDSSPAHWPTISLNVDKNALAQKCLRVETQGLDKETHTNIVTLAAVLGHALSLSSSDLSTYETEKWTALNLPITLPTPYPVFIDQWNEATYQATSLADAIGQAIVSINFWDEPVFDLNQDSGELETDYDLTVMALDSNLKRYKIKWDATPALFDMLWETPGLTENQLYSLSADLRYRTYATDDTKALFVSTLLSVVRAIPNGGKTASYMVSPCFDQGDCGDQKVVAARNAQHALACYMVEEALMLKDEIQYYDVYDFDIYKLTKSTFALRAETSPLFG